MDDTKVMEEYTQSNVVKLHVANMLLLAEDYEKEYNLLQKLLTKQNKFSLMILPGRRNKIQVQLAHVGNTMSNIVSKIMKEWTNFTKESLHTPDNIIAVSNGDTYYITSVMRIAQVVNNIKIYWQI